MSEQTNMDPITFLAAKYGMEREAALRVLKVTCFKELKTLEQVTAAAILCVELGLNPFRKEVHAFTDWRDNVILAIGVDGFIQLANRSGRFSGVEFSLDDWAERELTYKTKKGVQTKTARLPSEATCILTLEGSDVPTRYTVYLDEEYMNSEPWYGRTTRMLRNRAYCQAVRFGLGVTGVVDEQDRAIIQAQASEEERAEKRPVEDAASDMSVGKPAISAPTTKTADEVIGEFTEDSEQIDPEAAAAFKNMQERGELFPVETKGDPEA